ncbi:MAG: hypothetical protein COA57_09220 [Flavobacteriales bacterium]|nr:hypothetical protein [Bacteroidales bacterium AH-315-I05]PCJ84468.1 MAG: hypothetical protein COA57_09220 [Flavobacteriales bacterium]
MSIYKSNFKLKNHTTMESNNINERELANQDYTGFFHASNEAFQSNKNDEYNVPLQVMNEVGEFYQYVHVATI